MLRALAAAGLALVLVLWLGAGSDESGTSDSTGTELIDLAAGPDDFASRIGLGGAHRPAITPPQVAPQPDQPARKFPRPSPEAVAVWGRPAEFAPPE